jgi:preprotein translocase subunit SecB
MSTNEPEIPSVEGQPLPQYVLPASIRLLNVLVAEISAKRYPVEISPDLEASSHLSLEDVVINEEKALAQVVLSVSIDFQDDPKPFEIAFKTIGSFVYAPDMPKEATFQFLNSGSLGVLLPFARELLMNLCTRLQVPIIILPMIQLTPLPAEETQDPLSHE